MTPFRAPGRLSPGPAAVIVTWRPVPSLLRAARELTPENCNVYIIEDRQRAGGRIATHDLHPMDVEKHDGVWKYVFHDTDGNETGIGGQVRTAD